MSTSHVLSAAACSAQSANRAAEFIRPVLACLAETLGPGPQGILVLTYNRHAAAEIRACLRNLAGEDAARVTVSTCHALAMRLVGASFSGDIAEKRDFDGIVREAVRQINGESQGV